MSDILNRALENLAKHRKCFHSEADLQFALAWQIKETYPHAKVRLEMPVAISSGRSSLDLYFETPGMRTAVEIKYFKGGLDHTEANERFILNDNAAHDSARYDFMKDIHRVERILGNGLADRGFALLVTNHPTYWKEPLRAGTADEHFRIHDGREACGELCWAAHTGGTMKGREGTISLAGRYPLAWRDYSNIPNQRRGLFRMLLVEVQAAKASLSVQPPPKKIRTSLGPRRTRNYQALAAFLEAQQTQTVTLAFSEIEKVIGRLPESARKHNAWWANHARNPQARWLDIGWKVDKVSLSSQQVAFKKSQT